MKKAIKVGLSLVTAVTVGYVGYKVVKFFKEVADELHTSTGTNTDADTDVDTDVDTVDEDEEEEADSAYDTKELDNSLLDNKKSECGCNDSCACNNNKENCRKGCIRSEEKVKEDEDEDGFVEDF